MEQLCLSSFVYHGHDVHLYVYSEVEGIPDGVVVKDGNDIFKAGLASVLRDKNDDKLPNNSTINNKGS